MKKSIRIVLTAAVIAALMVSCAEDPVLPTAEFTFEPAEVSKYDEVTFTNSSTDADSYAWDFGDGSTSTEMDPTHVYMTTGTFTVKLVATNADGDDETEQSIVVGEPNSVYTLNGSFVHKEVTYTFDNTEFAIDSTMFWYVSPMGGDPYIRLLTAVGGQENPDLLKLYPNKGLNEIAGTYTWDSENPAGTYYAGYTAGYAGLNYVWTAIGKTGSGDLVITEVETGLYMFEAEIILSIGTYNYETGEFTEVGTVDLVLDYIGGITAL